MYPDRNKAETIFGKYSTDKKAKWVNHSKIVAECAYLIAERTQMLDAEKAYTCGLLHDIGRSVDETAQFRHIILGFQLMLSLGYEETAKTCFTHSFPNQRIGDYVGKIDVGEREARLAEKLLLLMNFDEFDQLIQLSDALCMSNKMVSLETRQADIVSRYGSYPTGKMEKLQEIKKCFEQKINGNIYELLNIK